jgi:hypothetical protein
VDQIGSESSCMMAYIGINGVETSNYVTILI